MRICKEKDCGRVCYGKKDVCKMHYSRMNAIKYLELDV